MPKEKKNREKNQADWREFEKREALIKTRSKFFSHLSISLLTFLLALGLFQAEFDGLQGFLVDALFRIRPNSGSHPAIKLVAYDLQSSAPYQITQKIPVEDQGMIKDV